MKHIKIRNKKWKVEIDLHGGRNVNLLYGDRCILGTYNRIDGKLGNTHICVPNFAHEGVQEFDLPFHGPARNQRWNIVQPDYVRHSGKPQLDNGARPESDPGLNQDEKLKIFCLLPQTEKYRADLLVSQTFEFHENNFIHKVTVEHQGGEPVPLNIGIHNYWNSPNGWYGALVNGEDITRKVKINGDISLKKKNTIELPRMQAILWEVEGFTHAVVWSAFKGSDFDNTYVCIEPVRGIGEFFGSEKSIIKPEQKINVCQKITIF